MHSQLQLNAYTNTQERQETAVEVQIVEPVNIAETNQSMVGLGDLNSVVKFESVSTLESKQVVDSYRPNTHWSTILVVHTHRFTDKCLQEEN